MGSEEKLLVGEERHGENHLYHHHLLHWRGAQRRMLIWDSIAVFPDGHLGELTLSLLSVSLSLYFFVLFSSKGSFHQYGQYMPPATDPITKFCVCKPVLVSILCATLDLLLSCKNNK